MSVTSRAISISGGGISSALDLEFSPRGEPIVVRCGDFTLTCCPFSGIFHTSYGAAPEEGKRDLRQRDLILDAPVDDLGEILSLLQQMNLSLPPGTEYMLKGLADGSIPKGDVGAHEIAITGILRFAGDGWWNVPVSRVEFPGGRKGTYFTIGVPLPSAEAVSVLPLTADGRVGLIHAYRHGTREWRYEVVNGVIDEGETPQEAALREALEEGGLRSSPETEIVDLGDYVGNYGCEAGKHRLLLTRGLEFDPSARIGGEGEAISHLKFFPVAEVLELYDKGEIIDGKLAALLMRALIRGLLPGVQLKTEE